MNSTRSTTGSTINNAGGFVAYGSRYSSFEDFTRSGSIFSSDRMMAVAASRKEAEKRIIRQCESKVDQLFKVTAPEKYGYEMRDGQYDMAMDIMEALEDGDHIAVEAGVGIGKSFAYLAPMILLHKETGRPVIIATSTIALQEQLVGDVEKMAEMLGVRLVPLVAKGQTNYLCRKRAESYLSSSRINLKEELVDAIIADVDGGCTERTAFHEQIPDKAWDRMCVKRYSKSKCNQKSCPYYRECAYCRLRDEMPRAGFTICNQDLLTVHLNNMSEGYRAILNPDAKYIVVDEAHNLEDKVRSMTTTHMTADSLHNTIDNALNQGARHSEVISSGDIVESSDAVDAFFWNLQQQRKRQINKMRRLQNRNSRNAGNTPNRRPHSDDAVDRFFVEDENGAYELLRGMTRGLRKILDGIDIGNAFDDNNLEYSAVDDLERTIGSLEKLCRDIDGNILWMERCRGGIEFSFCPKDTAGLTKRLYFDGSRKVVLTSATLTGKNSGTLKEQYAYFTKGIGFPSEENGDDAGVLSDPKASPFDYDSRAMIYYCDDLPHPTSHREEFIAEGTERLIELLTISHGRTLVLFTAKEDME
ncbi:MAG: ATP-dependent DNA helicase, partial [Clostridiales bacterium]|nr:ATP-dependent DNA helicase [Clostridiales bacterium]